MPSFDALRMLTLPVGLSFVIPEMSDRLFQGHNYFANLDNFSYKDHENV